MDCESLSQQRKRGAIITCDTAGRRRRRSLFELGGIPERKLDKSAQEWERGMNIAYSKMESFTDKWHYIITDTPGHRDFIKSTITGASQADVAITMVSADGNSTTEIPKDAPTAPEDHRCSGAAGPMKKRMLGLSESEFTNKLKEPSLGEDVVENGYQKDRTM